MNHNHLSGMRLVLTSTISDTMMVRNDRTVRARTAYWVTDFPLRLKLVSCSTGAGRPFT